MRLLFCMLGELGHYFPTFPLAQTLRAAGHEVVYTGIRDLQHEIESRGFGYVPVHTDVMPAGTLARLDGAPLEERDALNLLHRARVVEEVMDDALEERFAAVAPDVALVDVVQPALALLVHRLGVPCLRLSTSLSQRLDELPPITTALTPDAPFFELAQARHDAARPLKLVRVLKQHAYLTARCGYPPERVILETAFAPALASYREALLCPAPLDFARRTDGTLYLGAHVELDRVETVPTEIERFVDPSRRLLFASLGSQAGRYPHAERFFRAVMEATRSLPDWQVVIAAGTKFASHSCLANPPPNALVVARAPQLWLLRRATTFATHAGLGSVREAVSLGVPMLAVPQAFDQPGNAARVVHHGLGLQHSADTISGAHVERALAAIVADVDGYEERLARLDAACRHDVDSVDPVRAIEEVFRAGSPRTRAPRPATVTDERSVVGWVFVGRDGKLAEGGVLEAGATLVQDDGPPVPGVRGIGLCASIGDALTRAVGPVLARVESCGAIVMDGRLAIAQGIRCVWMLDVERELFAYADWCQDQVQGDERITDQASYALLRAELHELRALGDDPGRAAAWQRFERRASRLAPRGYEPHIGLRAAHDAARYSRWNMTSHLALLAAGAAAGTEEGVRRFDAEQAAARTRADAELLRRIEAQRE